MQTDSHQRRFIWLDLVEKGTTAKTIASRWKVSVSSVEIALDDARRQLAAFVESLRLMNGPPLYLFFPVNGLRPDSTCNHDRVPLPDGTLGCCAICHRSGRDGHLALQRFPAVEPLPEPKRPALAETGAEPTRKQKRAAAAAKRGKKQTAA